MYFENIILGAGPSGIQLGYFMYKHNLNYLIIEKTQNSGSFFEKYPHSKELISLNKNYTGSDNNEFNLRHDWNSLLNDEGFLFKQYSKELYPNSNDLKKYLIDFSEKFGLNIVYNLNIIKIEKTDNLFYLFDNDDMKYYCKNLIIATGLSKKVMPKLLDNNDERFIHYSDFPNNYFKEDINLNKFNNKHIVFIGSGNSTFELANILINHCATIAVWSRTKLYENSSLVTKYSGALRMKYLKVADSFYLKSQVALIDDVECNKDCSIGVENNMLRLDNSFIKIPGIIFKVICCTGWKFDDSIFNFNIEKTLKDKFPKIDYKYQSTNVENLYFIGNLMHSTDYKISSGGFIHGFRYLIKLFTHINYKIPFKCKIFQFNGSLSIYNELAEHIMLRINTSSDLYQMHTILCDNFYYEPKEQKIYYYENVTINLVKNGIIHNCKNSTCVGLENVLERNKKFDVRNVHVFERYNQSYLHVAFYIQKYDKFNYIKTLPEELFIDFSSELFLSEIKDILKTCPLII